MVTTIQELRMRMGQAMLGLAAACGLALVLVLGCGEDEGLGRRYPVHGRVMYRSQPLESGQITFHPIAAAGTPRDATGTIQDGPKGAKDSLEGTESRRESKVRPRGTL